MHSVVGRAAALLAVLGLGAAPAAPAVAAPVAAAAPPSAGVLTIMGEGGYLAGHRSAAFDLAAGFGVGVEDADDDWVTFTAGNHGPAVYLSIGAPTGSPRLTVGRYTTRRGWEDPHAQLELSWESRGCSHQPGTFDVLALSRSPEGRLTSLALDYSLTCDIFPAPVVGSLRWNSEVPYRYTDPTGFAAPDTAGGRAAVGAVTLTNTGSAPQTYGRSTWQPDPEFEAGQPAPTITRDGCAGVTLAPGSACRVELSVMSDGVHPVAGHVRTPDETLRGAAYAPVTMTAVPAPTPVVLTATSARGAVELSSPTSAANPSYRVLRSADGGAETEVARDVTMPWTDTAVTPGTRYTYRVVPVSAGAAGDPSNAVTTGALPVPDGAEGSFVPIDPVRVVDTRDGTGGRRGALGAGATFRFDPSGTGDIPRSGVEAVLLNVTGTEATTVTHVRAWPAGDPRPETSSLNLVPGQNRPNQVVVPLGADGQVELYNNAGSTHLVVDVQGFYSTADGLDGGGYHPTTPARVLDTRLDDFPLGPGEEVWLPVSAPGVDWSTVTAVDVNLTVTQPSSTGHLTAWPGDLEAPLVSNANFLPGQTVANHAVVPVSFDEAGEPGIAVRNSAGETHLVVDVQGWYDDGTGDGLRFATSPTSRVLDTRVDGGPVPPGETVAVPGEALPPGVAHVANVTATGSSGAGHLTVWSGVGALPPTSSLNFARNEDAPNLATALARPDGGFAVTAGTSPVHVVVDHLGFFY